MYSGFPALPVATAPTTSLNDAGIEDRTTTLTVAPPVHAVRLSYPALCHLLYLSKTPSVRFGIFGRLYGLQLDNVVEVGSVCMNPPRERVVERESDEDRRKRLEEEQRKMLDAFEKFERFNHDELLDAYQVGTFAISSATFNPFSSSTVRTLTELVTSSQPAVLVTYDPFRTALLGKPHLRAFTLTDEYIQYFTVLSDRKSVNESKLLRECGVTRSGVLREVPLTLDVDAFHQLGVEKVDVTPSIDCFDAINSDAVGNYIEALLSSVQDNTSKFTRQLEFETKGLERESNTGHTQPLGQSVEAQLALFGLKEQTQHLEALCDSILVNTSLLRDI